MADRAISALPTATTLTASDLFVLSQSNQAKNTTWQTIIGYLTTALDGHGGIQSITYTPPVLPSLDGTLTITLADSTHYDVTVTNGNGVTGVVQHWAVSSSNSTAPSTWYTTLQTMTPTNKYLWNYMTLEMDDGNDIDTTPCVAGVYGDTGQAWYVWIRYAGSQPTSDADIGTTPDDWIGVYSGTESDPDNLHYTDFDWFQYKGATGATGAAATITTQNVSYQASNSGTVAPSGSWTTTIPTVPQGSFLWTRTQLLFNDGTTVTSYSVSRYGIDGTGAVSTVNGVSPDGSGNVVITASDIAMQDNQSIETNVTQLQTDVGDVASLITTASTVVPAINELKTSITNIQRDIRKVLFVGDSYGAQTDNWVDFCAAKLGLSSSDYVNASVSGTGFIVDSASHIGSSYNGFLDQLVATTANRNTFTDVVICGGINDAQYDTYQTFLGDHIRDCITYIKTYFPNARPHIGFIGGALENSSVLSGRTWSRRAIAKYAYISQSAPYYLNGVENAIHQSAYLYSSDKLHPNATGSELIGDAVAQAIKTGSVEIYQAEQSVNITAGTGTSVSTSNAHLYFENDKAKFTIDIDFAAGASGNYGISAGLPFKLQDKLFFNKKATTLANGYCHISGGASYVLPLKVELYQDTITFFPVALSGSSWGTFNIDVFGLPTGVDVVFPSDWIN